MNIKNVTTEEDYLLLLDVESQICQEEPSLWHMHTGGIRFQRYFMGSGKDDIFHYAKLIFHEDRAVGYAFLYMEENEFFIQLLPFFRGLARDAILMLEYAFCEGRQVYSSCHDESLMEQYKFVGYRKNGENRYHAVANLFSFIQPPMEWEKEEIHLLSRDDFRSRVEYSAIPTGNKITERMFADYLLSSDHKHALDYIVTDKATKNMAAYCSFWLDEKSYTAVLKPAACLPDYRGRSILARSIFYGLGQLKNMGYRYVYVDTNVDNTAAAHLYECTGFCQSRHSFRMRKSL